MASCCSYLLEVVELLYWCGFGVSLESCIRGQNGCVVAFFLLLSDFKQD
ncbi:MAG: hypothetical protein LBJ00_05890 [Planctomycetaceae bacterium]|nr:hypothetical protein [Planctomycetaceae bacterium]